MTEEEDTAIIRRRRVSQLRIAAESGSLNVGQREWLLNTANELADGMNLAPAELAYAAFLVGKSIL